MKAAMHTLTRAEVREVDRLAIEEYGLPGIVLMENAGASAARLLHALGIDGPVAIACGRGNNGGDGFVIARHLELLGPADRRSRRGGGRRLAAGARPPHRPRRS